MSTTIPLPVSSLASSSSHLFLASGSTLHTYSSSSQSCTSSSASSSSTELTLIRHIAISPDHAHIATLSDDKSLCIFSLSSSDPPSLLSTRTVPKRASHLSWSSNDSLILSDRVGDVYLYPRLPRAVPISESEESRNRRAAYHADPSLHPDADLLLGHTSIVTHHLVTPDGKRIITADRDEHIRISRHPDAFVIDKYLFGSEGFVSALHIPIQNPNVLISGGGEKYLRIWKWQDGQQIGSIGIYDAVLPHRRVRSHLRRAKAKKRKVEEAEAQADQEKGFYDPPEGMMLPSGEGVLVKKIESMVVEGKTVILFLSEGCAAIHTFIAEDSTTEPPISTLSLSYPVLDFVSLPGEPSQIIISLDTAWGVIKANSEGGAQGPKVISKDLSQNDLEQLGKTLVVAQIASDGRLSLVPDHPILPILYASLAQPELQITPAQLAPLQLYPLLPLLPRWPGLEEDDELAGPAESTIAAAEQSAPTENGDKPNRTYSREELEQLNVKQLGRLKAQGVDVGDLIAQKQKKMKDEVKARKKAKVVLKKSGIKRPEAHAVGSEQVEQDGVQDEEESAGNA